MFPVQERVSPARDAAPHLSDRAAVLFVSSGTSTASAGQIVQERSVDFPVLYDDGKAIARTFQLRKWGAAEGPLTFPFLVVIDAQATVAYAQAVLPTAVDGLLDLPRRLEQPGDH